MEVPNLTAVLRDGIRLAEEEKNSYKRWFGTDVELPRVREWVKGALKEQWGNCRRAYMADLHSWM